MASTATTLPRPTVASSDITDGSIVNADVNASAAIAGSKIAPDFGAQTVATSGALNGGTITATTAFLSSAGYIGIGSAVAAAGLIRLGKATTLLAGLNQAESALIPIIRTDSSNNVIICAANGGGTTASFATYIDGSGGVFLRFNGTDKAWTTTSSLTLNTSTNLIFTTATASVFWGSATGVAAKSGTGTPEGAITAPVGSIFLRSDGGAGTTLYVKESGTGNTGWVAK